MSNKKISSELKVLRGTFRKDRAEIGDPLCRCDKIPLPPKFLSGQALKEWKRIAPELYEASLLTKMDVACFSAYCSACGRFTDALNEMEGQDFTVETTQKNIVQHILVGIINKAAEQILKFGKEFGLTPASRSKVSAKMTKKKKDPWEEFES